MNSRDTKNRPTTPADIKRSHALGYTFVPLLLVAVLVLHVVLLLVPGAGLESVSTATWARPPLPTPPVPVMCCCSS